MTETTASFIVFFYFFIFLSWTDCGHYKISF